MDSRLLLYCNTIRFLRPVQMAGQLVKPLVMKSAPSVKEYRGSVRKGLKTVIPVLDLDPEYLARFDLENLQRSVFFLLNETHAVDISVWKADASPLWNFHLHYFEYAIALAARYSQTNDSRFYWKFRELVRGWIAANPAGRGDAWHPYTISMRLPNWCICFDLFGGIFQQDDGFRDEVRQSMYAQYQVLLKRQELWQLGNHYLENLKTIVFCSCLFNEPAVLEPYTRRLLREIEEEILPDGMHFERSLLYHKIVLEDMLRIAYWLKQTNRPQLRRLIPVIQKMVSALASLENGMGRTPLFNDAGDGSAKTSAALIRAAKELFDLAPVLSDAFIHSGYYKIYDGSAALMFDAGEIGPPYMAGHGHCDCLSFELSLGGEPLFVNSGTYAYQGPLRGYFRSTPAHNTLTIGGREQSECWGEHRVARRISHVRAEKSGQRIIGAYQNSHGDLHTRVVFLAGRSLSVLDATGTRPGQDVHSYLHIAPHFSLVPCGSLFQVMMEQAPVCTILAVDCTAVIRESGDICCYSEQFGKLDRASVLDFRWKSDEKQHGFLVHFNPETGL